MNGRWLRGERGEWYVAGQVVLLALVFFGPRSLAVLPAWPAAVTVIMKPAGIVLMLAGVSLLLAGLLQLGMRNLTPLPYPRESGALVQTGPYAVVRHPMYAGGVLLSIGWALAVQGWLTLVYALALFVFADIKASREEQWLRAVYPEYADYARRVRKLIPFVR